MDAKHLICIVTGIVLGATAQVVFVRSQANSHVAGAARGGKEAHKRLSGLTPGSGGWKRGAGPIGKEATNWDRTGSPAASGAEFQAYLERHGYSKDALLAVILLSRDREHLLEAARRYPDDPNIQMLVICEDVLPGERREWLERFKATQPDNLLGALFLGGDLLASGEVDAGLSELRRSLELGGYEDFASEGVLAMESALIEFGHSPIEAKLRSFSGHALRHQKPIHDDLQHLRNLIDEAADPGGKEELAELGAAVGRRLSQGKASFWLINELTGMSLEQSFLKELDGGGEVPDLGKTAEQRLAEIQARRNGLIEDVKLYERAGELTEQQFVHYIDRTRTAGSRDASIWLREQLGDQAEKGADQP